MNSPQIQQALAQVVSQYQGQQGQGSPYQQAMGSPWSGQGQYQAQTGQMSPLAQSGQFQPGFQNQRGFQDMLMAALQGRGAQGECPPWMPNCNQVGGAGFGGGGGGATGMYGSRAGLTPVAQAPQAAQMSSGSTSVGPNPNYTAQVYRVPWAQSGMTPSMFGPAPGAPSGGASSVPVKPPFETPTGFG